MDIEKQRNELKGEIAARMRETIGRKKIVLKYLYERLGITHTTMQNYLRGDNLPDLFVLNLFARLCDEDVCYLVTGHRTKTPENIEKLRTERDQLQGQVNLLKEILEGKMQQSSPEGKDVK